MPFALQDSDIDSELPQLVSTSHYAMTLRISNCGFVSERECAIS